MHEQLLIDRVRPEPLPPPQPCRTRTLGCQWEMSLTVTPPSLTHVRRIARAHLHYWGLTNVEDVTLLGITELLTNVLKHTRSHEARLLMQGIHDGVCVTVRDDNPDLPAVGAGGLDIESGRGLFMLHGMVDGLGISPAETGKDVWFRVENHHKDGEDGEVEARR